MAFQAFSSAERAQSSVERLRADAVTVSRPLFSETAKRRQREVFLLGCLRSKCQRRAPACALKKCRCSHAALSNELNELMNTVRVYKILYGHGGALPFLQPWEDNRRHWIEPLQFGPHTSPVWPPCLFVSLVSLPRFCPRKHGLATTPEYASIP